MSTNWPKRKNDGTIFTNDSGTSWRWNGKGWILLRNEKLESFSNSHTVSTHSIKFDNISIGLEYLIDINTLNIGKITQIDIMSKWRNYIPLDNLQSFKIINNTKQTEVDVVSDFSILKNNQVDNFLLKTPLLVDELDNIQIVWSVKKLTNTPHYIEFDFHIHLES